MADQSIPYPGTLEPVESEGGATLLETLHSWVITVDHKRLGILYVVYSILFLLVAGVEAICIRIQLAIPDNHFLDPATFNRFFTMHGTTMVFLVGMPILFGFGNYLVPLMIGARDMAFPRLNAFSFWLTAFGGLFLYFSFVGGFGLYGMGSAPDVGWFAYAPLTARAFSPGHSTDYWALALIVSGFGTLGTAINIIATIVSMRCKGMTLLRMPLFPWLMFVVSGLTLITITPLTAAQIMLLIDRYLGGHFFDTQAGGSAVVWMHFFWIFGHPEVYVLVMPAFAIANEIIPVFSRKAIFGYPAMVAASACIAFVSVSVWAHHMFTVGMTSSSNAFFTLSTMLVGIPTGIKIFNWIATMWGGKIRFATPMLFCTAFLFQFLIAGLTGIMLAVSPLELATAQLLLRDCSLSLCAGRGDRSVYLCSNLLLVPQSDRTHDERNAREMAFLALHYWISCLLRHHAHSGNPWNASVDLYLPGRPWLGHAEPRHLHRRIHPGHCGPDICLQPDRLVFPRSAGWK